MLKVTLFGYRITVVSAVRVQQIEQMDISNPTKSYAKVGLCALLEPLLGVTNACLPFLGPILQLKLPRVYYSIRQTLHKSTLTITGRRRMSTSTECRSNRGWWSNKVKGASSSNRTTGENDIIPLWKIENPIGAGDKVYDSHDPAMVPVSGIRIKQEWLVQEEARESS